MDKANALSLPDNSATHFKAENISSSRIFVLPHLLNMITIMLCKT